MSERRHMIIYQTRDKCLRPARSTKDPFLNELPKPVYHSVGSFETIASLIDTHVIPFDGPGCEVRPEISFRSRCAQRRPTIYFVWRFASTHCESELPVTALCKYQRTTPMTTLTTLLPICAQRV